MICSVILQYDHDLTSVFEQFQIIAWEVITLEELYPKMTVMHIMNLVLHRQKRPPLDGMSGKFSPLCEVRLCFCFSSEWVSSGFSSRRCQPDVPLLGSQGLWKQNPAERISLADALKVIEAW